MKKIKKINFYVLQKNNPTVLKNVCENSLLGLLRCSIQTIPNIFALYMLLNENPVVCNLLVLLFKSATPIWPTFWVKIYARKIADKNVLAEIPKI